MQTAASDTATYSEWGHSPGPEGPSCRTVPCTAGLMSNYGPVTQNVGEWRCLGSWNISMYILRDLGTGPKCTHPIHRRFTHTLCTLPEGNIR